MTALRGERQSAGPSPKSFLGGLIAAILITDVLLLVVSPSEGMAQLLRVACAMGAFVAVALGVAIGFVRKPRYGLATLLVSPFVVVYAYTGLLLPWTQLSFYVGQVLLESMLSIPVVGGILARAFFGGFTLSAETLRIAFHYHYAIVSLAFLGLLVPVVRVVRDRHHSPGTNSPE